MGTYSSTEYKVHPLPTQGGGLPGDSVCIDKVALGRLLNEWAVDDWEIDWMSFTEQFVVLKRTHYRERADEEHVERVVKAVLSYGIEVREMAIDVALNPAYSAGGGVAMGTEVMTLNGPDALAWIVKRAIEES